MKKKLNLIHIIAVGFIIVSIVCVLSSFKYYDYTDTRKYSHIQVHEAKLNGHYYVIASTWDHRGGVSIIHSPNCKCGKR